MNIPLYGEHLKDKRIGFVIGTDIASYNAPKYIYELRKYGGDVIPYIYNKNEYINNNILSYYADNLVSDISNIENIDAIIIFATTDKETNLIINKLPKDIKILLITNSSTNYSNINVINYIDSADKNVNKTVSSVVRYLSNSIIAGVKILVTAGPTPVKIDNVRRMTNKFSGKLGIEIANELYLRGADVMLYQSYSGIRPPEYIPQVLFQDYDEYKELCINNCNNFDIGIFSAAVADYKPKDVVLGKIPSGGVLKSIELIQTEKVINLVKNINPKLDMISFKYEEGKTLEQLVAIAKKRLLLDHKMVVVNDISLNVNDQKCFMCELINNDAKVTGTAIGKINIAREIANKIESLRKDNAYAKENI